MLTLILLAAIAIVGFVVGFLVDKYGSYTMEGLVVLMCIIGGTATCVLLITGALLINIEQRFDNRIEEYNVITEMVDSYNGQDYGNMTPLVESVVSMNMTIARHKAYYNSKWHGLWYSEKIANLEPIRFDKNIPALE